MLAKKYDDAIDNHSPREHWMEEFEFLITPVRLIEPKLGSFDAFMRVLPKRMAYGQNTRTARESETCDDGQLA
jgi:hypothetical protein